MSIIKTVERIKRISHRAGPVITGAFIAILIATCALAQAAEPASQELVQSGAYLAHAGDCSACHTARGGQPFAGGVPIHTPIGTIYSTNITPDRETGIGRYSEDDFLKAMREGVAQDGHHLYPAMPYPSFTRVSRHDLSALYVFFMQGVEPVYRPNRPTKLNWPLSMRSLMAVWNALYLTKGEYASVQEKSASWNRGAYLVQGLGHCGDCHTPRGLAGQVKSDSEQDGSHYLAGATLDNWRASTLTGDRVTGLYAWSREEIVEVLRTGRTARVAAIGVMADVVAKSTQYLNDQDLMAIAGYLKSLPPATNQGENTPDIAMQASNTSVATQALRAGNTEPRGSRVYLDNCNACHRSDGSGARRTFPDLAKNETINAHDPVSLIHLVLAGSAMPSTHTAPSAIAMPDLGWRLSDGEIADVLSFIRASWGNHTAEVSSDEVRNVRKTLAIQKTAQ
jgi:mono/diheme cytochrome c family protein